MKSTNETEAVTSGGNERKPDSGKAIAKIAQDGQRS